MNTLVRRAQRERLESWRGRLLTSDLSPILLLYFSPTSSISGSIPQLVARRKRSFHFSHPFWPFHFTVHFVKICQDFMFSHWFSVKNLPFLTSLPRIFAFWISTTHTYQITQIMFRYREISSSLCFFIFFAIALGKILLETFRIPRNFIFLSISHASLFSNQVSIYWCFGSMKTDILLIPDQTKQFLCVFSTFMNKPKIRRSIFPCNFFCLCKYF